MTVRIRSNFQLGSIGDNPLAIGATVINSPGFANLPVVTAPDFMVLELDPARINGAPEIIYVTAHTAAATSVTVLRGQENTAARAHNQGERWVHGPTAGDFWGGGQTWYGSQSIDGSATLTGALTALSLVASGGNVTANGGYLVSAGVGGVPRLYLKATDSAADQKVWDIVPAGGNSLMFRMINDAENAASAWLTITRSGYVPRVATLAADLVVTGSTGPVGSNWGIVGPRNQLTQVQKGGSYTTASTVYTDYGFPSGSLAKQNASSSLLVRVSGSAYSSAAGVSVTFALSDGFTNYDIGSFFFNQGSVHMGFALVAAIGGIASGSKTWALRWKVNTGTVYMDASDQIAFEVQEVAP